MPPTSQIGGAQTWARYLFDTCSSHLSQRLINTWSNRTLKDPERCRSCWHRGIDRLWTTVRGWEHTEDNEGGRDGFSTLWRGVKAEEEGDEEGKAWHWQGFLFFTSSSGAMEELGVTKWLLKDAAKMHISTWSMVCVFLFFVLAWSVAFTLCKSFHKLFTSFHLPCVLLFSQHANATCSVPKWNSTDLLFGDLEQFVSSHTSLSDKPPPQIVCYPFSHTAV